VSRVASSASDGVNHELETRSVVCYINIVTFLSWSLAKAKIHMKNRPAIAESFTMRALPTGIIMEKGSILEYADIVNFPRVSPITESNSNRKPKLKLWVKNKVKNGHSGQYFTVNRAILDSVNINALLSNPFKPEFNSR
jgi:hypothetical protein